MEYFKGILATAAVASALLALPALAAPRPAIIATAGDDPGFVDTGLTSFDPIAGRGYSIDARLATLYDSNILRLGEGQTPRPGSEQADFRISPIVTGRIGVPIGRQQFFAGATIGADLYASNTQLNRPRFIAGGGLNLRAGTRCTSQIAANYSSRQMLLSDIADVIPNNQETLSYGFSANCQAPAGIGAGITVQKISTSNSAPSRVGFDVNSLLISPSISYARPALGTFSLSASLNYVTYPERFILTTEGQLQEDAVNIFSGRLGYQRQLGTRFNLTAGISYLQSTPQPNVILAEDAELEILFPTDRSTFSGMGYDASLQYTPSPRLSATLAFSRNTSASPNVGALYQVANLFGLDINYTLGSSFILGIGGTYSLRDYEDSFVTVDQPQPREQDRIGRVYGRITYSPPRPWSVSLLVAYQDRVSVPVIYSYDSFSALLSLSFQFGRQS